MLFRADGGVPAADWKCLLSDSNRRDDLIPGYLGALAGRDDVLIASRGPRVGEEAGLAGHIDVKQRTGVSPLRVPSLTLDG